MFGNEIINVVQVLSGKPRLRRAIAIGVFSAGIICLGLGIHMSVSRETKTTDLLIAGNTTECVVKGSLSGAGIGAVGGAGAGAVLGGVGIAACGTAVGVPVGVVCLIGAGICALIGGGVGGGVGAAISTPDSVVSIVEDAGGAYSCWTWLTMIIIGVFLICVAVAVLFCRSAPHGNTFKEEGKTLS